jgi:hypothetical protein
MGASGWRANRLLRMCKRTCRKQTLEDGYQRGDGEKLYSIHYTPLLQLLW